MEVMGHRGAMGLAPENSLRGFDAAMQRRVDWIELDVRCSRDGKLIVIHDEDLQRLAGLPARIADVTSNEILHTKTLSGEPFVTLEQAIEHIGLRAKLNIELKDADSAQPLARILADKSPGQYMVSSFSWPALRAFRASNTSIPIAKIRRWWPFVYRFQIRRYGLQSVCLRHNLALRSTLGRLHKQGLKSYVYTVDDPAEIDRLAKRGVWAVVRNRP